MVSSNSHYRGRFAPTPSGPLHLGSLQTALAGYLEARKAGGKWLLRIDDLDTPRCRPEHADTIMRQLEAHGLCWDEAPRRQSDHVAEYQAAFENLQRNQQLYRCRCTRAELAASGLQGPDGAVYSGRCRQHVAADSQPSTWRLRLDNGPCVTIEDRWLGQVKRDRRLEIGDFIVRRADGQLGYQLACIVDDLATGVTDIVRGADLIGSSIRQVVLFEAFGSFAPRYGHVPVITDEAGRKLSKQNHATPINAQHAVRNLQHCLQLLGQDGSAEATIDQLLLEATSSWNADKIPAGRPAAAVIQHA